MRQSLLRLDCLCAWEHSLGGESGSSNGAPVPGVKCSLTPLQCLAARYRGPGAAAAVRQRIVMLTAIPTAPCIAPYGDYLLALSIQNKQDYARLHSYELHVMAQAVDPQHTQPGPWQKVAQIQKVHNFMHPS